MPVVGDYLHRFPEYQDLIETICSVMTSEFAEAPGPLMSSSCLRRGIIGDYRIIREIGRGGWDLCSRPG